jgi:hypothetical protein
MSFSGCQVRCGSVLIATARAVAEIGAGRRHHGASSRLRSLRGLTLTTMIQSSMGVVLVLHSRRQSGPRPRLCRVPGAALAAGGSAPAAAHGRGRVLSPRSARGRCVLRHLTCSELVVAAEAEARGSGGPSQLSGTILICSVSGSSSTGGMQTVSTLGSKQVDRRRMTRPRGSHCCNRLSKSADCVVQRQLRIDGGW